MTKEEELRLIEVKNKLVLAKRYWDESLICLKNGGIRLATDGAYNAAEMAMKAGILLKGENVPKRHGGIAQKFSLLFVKTGQADISLGGKIKEGLKLRNKARYDEVAKLDQAHTEHNLNLAQELIEFLEKELKEIVS